MSLQASIPCDSLAAIDAGNSMVDADSLLLPVIVRLTLLLRSECHAIRLGQSIDYDAFNSAKSQSLLELARSGVVLRQEADNSSVQAALSELVSVLHENHRLLEIQLNAARAVSDLISAAVRDAQSDGTYSEYSWRD